MACYSYSAALTLPTQPALAAGQGYQTCFLLTLQREPAAALAILVNILMKCCGAAATALGIRRRRRRQRYAQAVALATPIANSGWPGCAPCAAATPARRRRLCAMPVAVTPRGQQPEPPCSTYWQAFRL
jgi:hypothetical protein